MTSDYYSNSREKIDSVLHYAMKRNLKFIFY